MYLEAYVYAISVQLPQEQYIFVYDAVRELLLLGDTTIKANDLIYAVSQLKRNGGGRASYQQQFAVSSTNTTATATICMHYYILLGNFALAVHQLLNKEVEQLLNKWCSVLLTAHFHVHLYLQLPHHKLLSNNNLMSKWMYTAQTLYNI